MPRAKKTDKKAVNATTENEVVKTETAKQNEVQIEPIVEDVENELDTISLSDQDFVIEVEEGDIDQRFIHSSFIADEMVTDDNEVWNILMSVYRTGAVMPVKIISVTEMSLGDGRAPTLCFVGKLQKAYSNYTVYIPYKSFFTVEERAAMKIEEMTDAGKHRFFNHFLRAYVDVRFTSCKQNIENGEIKERVIIGSREKALKAFRKKYFETGFVNVATNNLEPIKAGAIICNCKITRVNDSYVFIDVAGVPTMIPRSELSHLYIAYASDHYQTGDIVDVKILEIEEGTGSIPNLKCSIKALLPNKTLYALEKASRPENLGFKGEVIGKVTYIKKSKSGIHYNIATESGYNAIAFAQKINTLDKSWNKTPNPKKQVRVGSEVKFFPNRRAGNVMIGYITDVFN